MNNQLYCVEITPDPTSKFLKFKRPEIFKQIDRLKYTQEELNKIDRLTCGSKTKLWWICLNNHCGCHKWLATIYDRTRNDGKATGCPFCCLNRKLCIHSISIMNNSLLALEFDQCLNINIDPNKIAPFSNIELWWRCSRHKTCNDHIWRARASDRTNGSNCPFCSIQRRSACRCDNFMNNPLLVLLRDEFDFTNPNNKDINPYILSFGSHVYAWWKCSICNFLFGSTILNRSYGHGCPSCASKRLESKGEIICRQYLESIGIFVWTQIKLIYIPTRRYDFAFISNNTTYFIEIDGPQHFIFSPHWHGTFDNFINKKTSR